MEEVLPNVVGVVDGQFAPAEGEEDSRYSLTALAIFAMTMMDYHRNVESDADYAALIAVEVKDLFSALSGNGEIVAGLPPEEIIGRLLNGDILFAIRKIEYEEIREYMAAEAEVLQSL